jgi:hypothetical protein
MRECRLISHYPITRLPNETIIDEWRLGKEVLPAPTSLKSRHRDLEVRFVVNLEEVKSAATRNPADSSFVRRFASGRSQGLKENRHMLRHNGIISQPGQTQWVPAGRRSD